MSSAQTTETIVTVTGMTCDHCVRAVRGELSRLDGVSAVDVDLASGRVRIASLGPLPVPDVRAAVEEAGYEVAS
jgi:copper chaperone CopZ